MIVAIYGKKHMRGDQLFGKKPKKLRKLKKFRQPRLRWPKRISLRHEKNKSLTSPNSKTVLSGIGTHTVNYSDYTGTDLTTVTTTPSEMRRSWTRSSVNTPGWNRLTRRDRKASGIDLPMNPFSYSLVTDSGRSGSRISSQMNKVNGHWNTTMEYGDWGGNSFAPGKNASDSDYLSNKSLNKLLGKAKDQSVNLGWAVGEGRQTLNLFADNAKKIAGAARTLRQGNLVGAAAILTGAQPREFIRGERSFKKDLRRNAPVALANRWLELQYGWLPLLSDIYGSFEYLTNKLYKAPRLKETAFAHIERNEENISEFADFRVVTSVETTHTVRWVLYYTQSGNHDLSALGLTNPLSIAWEVTPWSFVVDWALPIGTYLNNLDAFDGLSFVKGCKTEFWKGTVLRVEMGKQRTLGDWVYTTTSNVRELTSAVQVSRQKLTSFPSSPLPSFKFPFKGGLIGPHALNAYALLTQAFGRK